MTPEELGRIQNAVNALDDAYWNHRDTDYAEALKEIADIVVPELERVRAGYR